ncbi:peroxidase family protein [Halococcus agarilyticus]|uniref:peroxidase family protein n=1 Tax=Halococcus agarilyticus TaxID=1232219 RepID=UPI0012AB40EF|nr:peroxidase family protein [Halococcus agarilyticus]
MSERYTLEGTVVSPPNGPLADTRIEAFDADSGPDDLLGTTDTDGDGRFELVFDVELIGGPEEGVPEVYVRVLDADTDLHTEAVALSDTTTAVDLFVPVSTDDGETGSSSGGSMGGSMSMDEKPGMPTIPHHGTVNHRGMMNVPRGPASPGHGRFGRLFPYLQAADHDVAFLQELGLPDGPLDEGETPVEEAQAPAGYVFLGQFIDHDITLDPLSSLSRQNDPDALRNFRTPRLDLDNVYGSGPDVSRHLYQSTFGSGPHSGDGEKFLLGLNDADEPNDLSRTRDGTAIIGDPRNDENLLVAQLQHAMLKFHNRVVDWLRDGEDEEVFGEAQQLVRWHYQWVVLEDFLPRVCQPEVVEAVRDEREYYTIDRDDDAYLPLEFAGAAYRFGHSQARFEYRVNDTFDADNPLELFGTNSQTSLGRGFEPVTQDRVVDWRHLFAIEGDIDPQPITGIDPKLAPDLLDLPFMTADEPWLRSLASRNLVRGRRLGLPSGQAVARAMEEEPLSNEEIGFDEALEAHDQPPKTEAPLWYYVLGEARERTGGERLGPVGSRIVAEVLVGLAAADPSSYLTVEPGWEPTLPAPHSDDGEFTMGDLLAFALDY